MTSILENDDDDDENELLEEEGIIKDDEELTLEELEEIEEDVNIGHKVQTFDPNDDGVDNYFDEKYFDE